MQKVLTAEEMREVDRLTTEKYGIPSIILMENAAHATARIITEKLGGSVKGKSFLILCGKGNNGGDGAAIGRLMALQGAFIEIILFGKIDETNGDAQINHEICNKLGNYESKIVETTHPDILVDENLYDSGGRIQFYEVNSRDEFDDLLYSDFYQDWNVVIDAVFGTGLSRPIEGWLGNVIHHVNILNDTQKNHFGLDRTLVSIDLPSGLYADSGNLIGINYEAELTITFTAPKIANIFPPASSFNGELHTVNIGSPQELINNSPSQTFLAEKKDAQNWFEKTNYSSDSYKNKRGNALLIVGSKNYTGAAVLAGNAAMQSGVGLVTIATSESAQESVSARILAEVMTQGVVETGSGAMSIEAFERIEELSEKADVLAIGSGLSSDEETTRKLVRKVVEKRTTPIVIDADGLNSLSPFDMQGSDEFPLVLTPHEGEFLRLLGTDDKEAVKDRIKAVRDFAEKHNVILVLKGERTLIAEPNGKVAINPTGNSGLGKAGNGDNLTGIITGFLAQAVQAKVNIFETVVAAVYVAGLAGDIAEKKFGKRTMLASDVRECLVDAFRDIEGRDE